MVKVNGKTRTEWLVVTAHDAESASDIADSCIRSEKVYSKRVINLRGAANHGVERVIWRDFVLRTNDNDSTRLNNGDTSELPKL